jgi:glyoxylase-like metal-dependent hydrolase (beta-lactamase superfamily II)
MARVVWFLTFALGLLPFALTPVPSAQGPAQASAYAVHAIRFATIPFQVSGLVAGADRSRTLDIAMMVWAATDGAGRVVLIDAGFYREAFLTRWAPRQYVKPSEAVAAVLGITPDAVTDIVVSHVHWDHVDGADLFPRARVWIQREEFTHHVGANGAVLDRAIAADDAKMLAGIQAAGRLQLIDGDDREILPGIRVYTGGKHTFASQYVSVRTRAGAVVIASDNAYLYENLEKRLAIAQTLDAASNLAAQARMLGLAAKPGLVVPGHDPAVFERFPAVKPGVARID